MADKADNNQGNKNKRKVVKATDPKPGTSKELRQQEEEDPKTPPVKNRLRSGSQTPGKKPPPKRLGDLNQELADIHEYDTDEDGKGEDMASPQYNPLSPPIEPIVELPPPFEPTFCSGHHVTCHVANEYLADAINMEIPNWQIYDIEKEAPALTMWNCDDLYYNRTSPSKIKTNDTTKKVTPQALLWFVKANIPTDSDNEWFAELPDEQAQFLADKFNVTIVNGVDARWASGKAPVKATAPAKTTKTVPDILISWWNKLPAGQQIATDSFI